MSPDALLLCVHSVTAFCQINICHDRHRNHRHGYRHRSHHHDYHHRRSYDEEQILL